MSLFRLACTALMILACSVAPAYAVDPKTPAATEFLGLAVGTGFEFETGDYGTDQTIDSWRIPFRIEWAPNKGWGISLEIPYVHQSGSSETVLLGGQASPIGKGNGRMTMASGSTLGSSAVSEEGFGDSTLNLDFSLFGDSTQTPKLLALGYAKLPTADKEKGLGTGEFDWGAGLGLSKRMGDWSSYAEALYITPGTSQTFDPSPYWEWLAALSYRTSAKLRPGVSLSGGTAAFAGAADPLQIKARLGIIGSKNRSFSLAVSHGLSESSPDWGGSISVYFDF